MRKCGAPFEFHAVVNRQFARSLQAELGVLIEKGRFGFRLPDVPQAIILAASPRSGQIDRWLTSNNLANSPLSRRLGASATRSQIEDRSSGDKSFARELLSSRFIGADICHRVTPDQTVGTKVPTLRAETRQVEREARSPARAAGSYRPIELPTLAP